MSDKTHENKAKNESGDAKGHLGQKKAREEKQREEMLRHMGDNDKSKSSKLKPPKLGEHEAEREKVSEEKLKRM